MKAAYIFERLWIQYSCENPSVGKIYDLFQKSGERVINDHVAFRTFNDPRVNIDVIAKPFLKVGYKPMGKYYFKDKKLLAKHFELPGNPESPRVFISELLLEEFSDELQLTIRKQLDRIPDSHWNSDEQIFQGNLFSPLSFETYKCLRMESEYAAWLYVYGFRANHFTVSINHLEHFKGIEEVNLFLKTHEFRLNGSGGEIKGTPEDLLEQSSTMADIVSVEFQEGMKVIPKCYYEFARRYKDSNGKLFSGFIAESADKIFESTDFRK